MTALDDVDAELDGTDAARAIARWVCTAAGAQLSSSSLTFPTDPRHVAAAAIAGTDPTGEQTLAQVAVISDITETNLVAATKNTEVDAATDLAEAATMFHLAAALLTPGPHFHVTLGHILEGADRASSTRHLLWTQVAAALGVPASQRHVWVSFVPDWDGTLAELGELTRTLAATS